MHLFTLVILASLFTSLTTFATHPEIVPREINPDTVSVLGLPWVQAGDSYRSSGTGLALDDEGNIYVVGHFEQYLDLGRGTIQTQGADMNAADIFLAKYDPQGHLQWIRTAGGQDDDKGLSIAISGDNIYITGYFSGICYFGDSPLLTKDRQNMFIANYSRNGELKWKKQAGSDGILRGTALTADSRGNVYITGNFREWVTFDHLTIRKQMQKNVYLVKMDSTGKVEWLSQASGGNSLITYLYVYGITCDRNDNIILAGEMMGPVRFGNKSHTTQVEYFRDGPLPKREVFFAKYDSRGNLSWMRDVGLEVHFGDVEVDKDNNILLTGHFFGSLEGKKGEAKLGNKTIKTTFDLFGDNTDDIYLAKYNPDGVMLWGEAFGGIEQNRGQGITSDPEGNIYITGFFTGKINVQGVELQSKKYRVEAKDIFTAKFTPDGNLEWIETAGSSKNDEAKCIMADNSGNIYVTGCFEGNAAFGKNWVTSKRYQNFYLARYTAEKP